MADPHEIRRLLGQSIAACQRYHMAARAEFHADAARQVREALALLQQALALDPTRSMSAWRDGDDRDRIRVSDRMVSFYIRYSLRAAAEGF